MGNDFWLRAHGASTHFPIVLLFISVVLDLLGTFWPEQSARRGLRAAGFFAALIAVLFSFAAVWSGLIISRWRVLGSDSLFRHHIFVWPALGIAIGLVVWRLIKRERASPRAFAFYLSGMGIASVLIFVAAFWGGELALAGGPSQESIAVSQKVSDPGLAARGRHLFLMNCAHCHGDDATGDEGPNLHGVRKTDARIATIINNGIKGEMPRFNEKLKNDDVQALIAFLRTLKG
jgi:mono/diheme cytochrome c family protein